MTDRDRLIELFSPFADGTYNSSGIIIDGTKVDDVVDNLLSNGVIVPPCKVGDNIYFIERHPERLGGTKINTAEVLGIKANISHKGVTFLFFVTYRNINGNDTCGEILYGRTAFKTKEEAEQELEKRGKENE